MKVDYPSKMANLQIPVATDFVGVLLAMLFTSFFSLNEFTMSHDGIRINSIYRRAGRKCCSHN